LYGGSTPGNSPGPRTKIAKEVFAVITTVFSHSSRQAERLGMSDYFRGDAAWQLRAPFAITGDVSVLAGGIKGDVCFLATDPTAVQGTSAWSPPT
jgi:hypothetical protein